jgi:hypothetical protein
MVTVLYIFPSPSVTGGVTEFEAELAEPVPLAFVAVTVNV